MNKYTFHINTERVNPSYKEVYVNASTIGRARKIIEAQFPWKGITLAAINDVPYMEREELDSYCPPEPEEKYWSDVTAWFERHCGSDNNDY